MPDVLDMLAAAYSDKPAVVQDDDAWTYTELNEKANALARVMLAGGIRPGDRAVWVGPNDRMVSVFGAAARKAQIMGVPLSYRFSREEMAYVITDSGASLVYTDPEYRAMVEGNGVRVMDHAEAEALIAATSSEPIDIASEGLGASMIYTSGTTGKPKGAKREATDPAIVGALITELGLRDDDVHITTGPLYHSGPAAFAALTTLVGGTTIILRRFDPIRWLELVDRHKVSTTFSAPTQLKRLVEVPDEVRRGYDTSHLRVVIANAAPVPYALKQRWIETFGEGHLFEVYGSTELGVDTVLRPEDQLTRPGSCGHPYGGIEIRLLREDGIEADVGEPGEMWIRTPGAFDGYHNAPEKTEETKLSDDPSWRSVGDIAYRDADGYLYICDRRSDMIISGGMNVYPAEIESVLHAHPAVMDVAVFGIPSEEWGESVHAVVQPKRGAAVSADQLDAHCREHLAGFKVPRSFEFREELPRTESGKLLKRILRDERWAGTDRRV